jgi:hypothetical protein
MGLVLCHASPQHAFLRRIEERVLTDVSKIAGDGIVSKVLGGAAFPCWFCSQSGGIIGVTRWHVFLRIIGEFNSERIVEKRW